MDLLDFFRGRYSWRKLRVLLTRLPVASAYRQAVLDDPEVAEFLASHDDEDGPPPSPPLSQWTPEVAHLARISDQIQALRIAVIAGNGGKPPGFIPERRPSTGVDRLALRRELAKHDDLVAEVKAAQERWETNRREAANAERV